MNAQELFIMLNQIKHDGIDLHNVKVQLEDEYTKDSFTPIEITSLDFDSGQLTLTVYFS